MKQTQILHSGSGNWLCEKNDAFKNKIWTLVVLSAGESAMLMILSGSSFTFTE